MTRTDILIIGQGICGTMLSWSLEEAGMSCILIDEPRPFTASRVAAGLINPVTGRRLVKTWMIDELLPFAKETYRLIGKRFGIGCIQPAIGIEHFPTVQMRHAFLDRYAEDPDYLALPKDENIWHDLFQYDLGFGIINHCLLIDLPMLLDAARKHLRATGRLLEERFDPAGLILSGTGIRYNDIAADRIVFCDGVAGATSEWFGNLPFASNKGEALILDIPDLAKALNRDTAHAGVRNGEHHAPEREIVPFFKKGISLAPWKDGLYWAGSSYEWSFTHDQPTETFRKRTESALAGWLKLPFKTIEHFASVRPATIERRPFAGVHPQNPAVGILNGMGTKGCSLAPYLAHQLVQHLRSGTDILPDADVRRFSKILGRKMR